MHACPTSLRRMVLAVCVLLCSPSGFARQEPRWQRVLIGFHGQTGTPAAEARAAQSAPGGRRGPPFLSFPARGLCPVAGPGARRAEEAGGRPLYRRGWDRAGRRPDDALGRGEDCCRFGLDGDDGHRDQRGFFGYRNGLRPPGSGGEHRGRGELRTGLRRRRQHESARLGRSRRPRLPLRRDRGGGRQPCRGRGRRAGRHPLGGQGPGRRRHGVRERCDPGARVVPDAQYPGGVDEPDRRALHLASQRL